MEHKVAYLYTYDMLYIVSHHPTLQGAIEVKRLLLVAAAVVTLTACSATQGIKDEARTQAKDRGFKITAVEDTGQPISLIMHVTFGDKQCTGTLRYGDGFNEDPHIRLEAMVPTSGGDPGDYR